MPKKVLSFREKLRGPSKLKRGQVVTIYEDPITEKKPEGEAKLIECLEVNTGYSENHLHGLRRLQMWRVAFLEDAKEGIKQQYPRNIMEPKQKGSE